MKLFSSLQTESKFNILQIEKDAEKIKDFQAREIVLELLQENPRGQGFQKALEEKLKEFFDPKMADMDLVRVSMPILEKFLLSHKMAVIPKQYKTF